MKPTFPRISARPSQARSSAKRVSMSTRRLQPSVRIRCKTLWLDDGWCRVDNMNWSLFLAQVLAGVANGGLYFLVASGLTLLWGALGVVNLAHGSYFMIASFGVAACIQRWGTEAGFVVGCLAAP